MRLDLHMHTVASDGAWTAEEVVEGALEGRLDVIAITDHDTTAAVGPAMRAARGRPVEVIPATELSSTRDGTELHILGYFVDPESAALTDRRERARERRLRRMEGMVERLCDAGVEVEMDAVLEEAGPEVDMIARPHLARVLVRAGHVDSVPEAFQRYLADGLPAFIPTALEDPVEAIDAIIRGGGLAVWAHPPGELVDPLLPELVDAGLRGLEVFRPRTGADRLARLRRVARENGLLVTGGSDWHDIRRNEPLGTFYVTGEEVAELLDEGGM